MSEINSLTKALWYGELCKQFLEDFKRSCQMDMKNQANNWLNKVTFIQKDIYSFMPKESRELFLEEFKGSNADPLFMESISEKVLRMDSQQRAFAELALDGILKGEIVIQTEPA